MKSQGASHKKILKTGFVFKKVHINSAKTLASTALALSSKYFFYINGTDLNVLMWQTERLLSVSSPGLPSSVLSCPGLPSPPLCWMPHSGSSGMWWPRIEQSPPFMAPRPTLEVCNWEPWSQSGGWLESIHPLPVLSDTHCPSLYHHMTDSHHANQIHPLHFIFFICNMN